jgi:hypothetical protein
MMINTSIKLDNITGQRATEQRAACGHPTTFVSAFVGGINEREDRKIANYIEYGTQLMSIDLPKVVFMDADTYAAYFAEREFPLTRFVVITKKDIYLYDYMHLATKFELVTGNPKKDTIDFVFVQCMKTDWVRQAIELDAYGSEQYVWIDFGIMHFMESRANLENGMRQINTKKYDKVRIACGKPPDFPYFTRNVYHQLIWMFIGSVFGGDKSALARFAELMRERCLEILDTKNHLMWEINVWYLIFFENVRLFDRFISNHSPNLLTDY